MVPPGAGASGAPGDAPRPAGGPGGAAGPRARHSAGAPRPFPKACGVAGGRVGSVMGHPPVAEAVRKTMLPFTVSSVAQAAAVASLAAEPELLERVAYTVKERGRVRDALLAGGWAVPPTDANFVWLRLSRHTPPAPHAARRPRDPVP